MFNYSIEKDTVIIHGLKDSSAKEIIFPTEIDGFTKLIIDKKAFANLDTLESVILSKSVIEIRDFAFSSCHNLREFDFDRQTTPKFGWRIFEDCSSVEHISLEISILSDYFPRFFSDKTLTRMSGINVPKKDLDDGSLDSWLDTNIEATINILKNKS